MSESQHDHTDDPAHHADRAEGDGDDWASEGGAVEEGPATHPADGEPDEDA